MILHKFDNSLEGQGLRHSPHSPSSRADRFMEFQPFINGTQYLFLGCKDRYFFGVGFWVLANFWELHLEIRYPPFGLNKRQCDWSSEIKTIVPVKFKRKSYAMKHKKT